jgi:hypothetical protein
VQEAGARITSTGLGKPEEVERVVEAFKRESNAYFEAAKKYEKGDLLGIVKDKDCLQVHSRLH